MGIVLGILAVLLAVEGIRRILAVREGSLIALEVVATLEVAVVEVVVVVETRNITIGSSSFAIVYRHASLRAPCPKP